LVSFLYFASLKNLLHVHYYNRNEGVAERNSDHDAHGKLLVEYREILRFLLGLKLFDGRQTDSKYKKHNDDS